MLICMPNHWAKRLLYIGNSEISMAKHMPPRRHHSRHSGVEHRQWTTGKKNNCATDLREWRPIKISLLAYRFIWQQHGLTSLAKVTACCHWQEFALLPSLSGLLNPGIGMKHHRSRFSRTAWWHLCDKRISSMSKTWIKTSVILMRTNTFLFNQYMVGS